MEKIMFDSVKVGYELPTVNRTMTQEAFWKYAVGSFDYNPVHCDPEWVKTAQPFKIPLTVAHGMMTMSLMTTVVTNWAFPAILTVRKITSKFLKPVQAGWTVTYSAIVSEKHVICQGKNYVVVEMRAENQNRDLVALGEAEVVFPD